MPAELWNPCKQVHPHVNSTKSCYDRRPLKLTRSTCWELFLLRGCFVRWIFSYRLIFQLLSAPKYLNLVSTVILSNNYYNTNTIQLPSLESLANSVAAYALGLREDRLRLLVSVPFFLWFTMLHTCYNLACTDLHMEFQTFQQCSFNFLSGGNFASGCSLKFSKTTPSTR